jgi:hypothetical protein
MRRRQRDPRFVPRPAAPVQLIDGGLRADGDAICPGCLQWIEGGAYVRRNVYDLLQHEACPVPARTVDS